MSAPTDENAEPMTAASTSAGQIGLCASCRHMRRVASPRGSVFYLCRRSATDSRYVKYPPLPVWTCVGYEMDEQAFPSREA